MQIYKQFLKYKNIFIEKMGVLKIHPKLNLI